ncbi:hypothetical protein CEXT_515821 [Caerostris extrusa]|uniref:Uncharacterized protein n=1 Tax=Caerostris extrusa TaxID=172846 RepID=A0AAV4RNS2_CAEEX|nr:hypothetical protein CEXT_515821 [Caerostris extrusa]
MARYHRKEEHVVNIMQVARITFFCILITMELSDSFGRAEENLCGITFFSLLCPEKQISTLIGYLSPSSVSRFRPADHGSEIQTSRSKSGRYISAFVTKYAPGTPVNPVLTSNTKNSNAMRLGHCLPFMNITGQQLRDTCDKTQNSSMRQPRKEDLTFVETFEIGVCDLMGFRK